MKDHSSLLKAFLDQSWGSCKGSCLSFPELRDVFLDNNSMVIGTFSGKEACLTRSNDIGQKGLILFTTILVISL